MSGPLVSVVMSAYNRPEMFREALLSVVGQTYRELEIVVQDDSTTDGVGDVVAAENDARVVYTRNRPPLGTAANTVAGYRKARGKYLCTLNDDDRYAPGYVAAMVAGLEGHTECSLAFADHTLIDGEGRVLEEETERNSRTWGRHRIAAGVIREPLEMALIWQCVPGMFAMVRRADVELEDFSPEVGGGYDYWLTYLALRGGGAAFYVDERLTDYRTHAGSQTAGFKDPRKMLESAAYNRYMNGRMLADARLAGIHAQVMPRVAATHAATGFAWLRLGDRAQAWRELWAAWGIAPSRRLAVGLALCALPMGWVVWGMRRRG